MSTPNTRGLSYASGVGYAMWQRSLLELARVKGGLLPTTIAPIIFLLGISAQFNDLSSLPGFPTDSYINWIIPLSCLQGAGFAGGATGANLARDIERGWFDRLLSSPAPRPLLLLGPVMAAMTRSLVPTTVILAVGLLIGPGLTGGIYGLVMLYLAAICFSVVASFWGITLALRAKTQQVGPAIQNGVFIAVFLSTAYTPLVLLRGWLASFAQYNPVTYVLQMARQATVSGIEPSWAHTWPGLVALAGMIVLFGLLALRQLGRIDL